MSDRYELITAQEMADLAEIDRLLHEANEHSLRSDGHCKSSEGHIGVSLGNHWDRIPDDEGRKPVGVTIYSYLLGPHRDHHFDDTAQALAVVRNWHAREMSYDEEREEYTASEPDLYLVIEKERREEFGRAMADFERAMGEAAIDIEGEEDQ